MASLPLRTLITLSAISIGSTASYAQCASERAQLTPSDETEEAHFGSSISVNGTVALIGAVDDVVAGVESGSAYLIDTVTGAEIVKLAPADGTAVNRFGWSVALTDDLIIVGAIGDRDIAGNHGGSVYVFDATTHALIREIYASDAAAQDRFGWAVAAHGPWLLVGALYHESPGLLGDGAVYLFNAATGTEVRSFLPSSGHNDDFGSALAINDTYMVIGAPGDETHGYRAGAIYVHDTVTGDRLYKLTLDDGIPRDAFGTSVALSGTRIIVGAPQGSQQQAPPGAVYVFDGPTGDQLHKLELDDGETWDFFGSDLSVSGDTVLVSTPGEDDPHPSAGAVYLFDVNTGFQIDKLVASDADVFDLFSVVAASGDTALIGATNQDNVESDSGSVYVFDLSRLGANYCTANANASGGAAIMSACGVASIAANDLTLSALSVPNSFYLFFRGTTQIQAPFGDGFRCAGGSIRRLQGPRLAMENVARRSADLPALGIVNPGTYNFQCWFRDSTAASGFNLSDGLQITFVP